MSSSRTALLLGIAPLALAVGLALFRGREPEPAASGSASTVSTAASVGSAVAPSGKGEDRLQYVMQLVREGGPEAHEKLARAYGEWAAEPEAVQARTMAMSELFNETALAKKVSLVLDAVHASTVPPEQDPLWHRLVESVASLWSGATFDKGRDLMMMESRVEPSRLLVDSFLEIGTHRLDELNQDQRNNLLSDLIDLYHNRRTAPATKPHIVETVRALGGEDLATVLSGADVRKGSKHPAIVEYERQLSEAEKMLLSNHAPSPR